MVQSQLSESEQEERFYLAPYTREKDGKHIKKTITVIDGIVEKIENKDYTVATRPDQHYRDCDMKHYCDSI